MAYKIFINYRRIDTGAEANTLHEKLTKYFGDCVFMDTHDIEIATNWVDAIKNSGSEAKIILVLIGDRWLVKGQNNISRLFDPEDWVRQEIELALERDINILPILYDTKMPAPADIPESIQGFINEQAFTIRHETSDDDIKRLLVKLCPSVSSKSKCFFKKHFYSIISALGTVLLIAVGFAIYQFQTFEPCPEYGENLDIRTLIFSGENKNLAKEIDQEFHRKCQSRFKNENHPYKGNEEIMTGERSEKAKACGADFFIAPEIINGDILVEFAPTNSALQQFQIDNEFEIYTATTHLEQSNYRSDMDRAVCLIAAYVKQSQDKMEEVASELLRCNFDTAPKEMQKVVNNLMTDSYIARDQLDSAMIAIDKSIAIDPTQTEIILKKAIIAEKLEKPTAAISSYTMLIDNNDTRKTKLIERRGDQYYKIEDYRRAQKDYKEVKQTDQNNTQINTKIERVDTKIEDIERKNTLNAFNALTSNQKVDQLNRWLQVGNNEAALQAISTIDHSIPLYQKIIPLEAEARFNLGDTSLLKTLSKEQINENPRLQSVNTIINTKSYYIPKTTTTTKKRINK